MTHEKRAGEARSLQLLCKLRRATSDGRLELRPNDVASERGEGTQLPFLGSQPWHSRPRPKPPPSSVDHPFVKGRMKLRHTLSQAGVLLAEGLVHGLLTSLEELIIGDGFLELFSLSDGGLRKVREGRKALQVQSR